MLVSWASCDAKLRQTTPLPTSNVTSVVFYGTNSSNLDQRAQGVATSYAYDYKDTGAISYASPVLHHVLLKGKHTYLLGCAQLMRHSPSLVLGHAMAHNTVRPGSMWHQSIYGCCWQ